MTFAQHVIRSLQDSRSSSTVVDVLKSSKTSTTCNHNQKTTRPGIDFPVFFLVKRTPPGYAGGLLIIEKPVHIFGYDGDVFRYFCKVDLAFAVKDGDGNLVCEAVDGRADVVFFE